MRDYSRLESMLGVTFNNTSLLETALTHRSFINEHPEIKEHNERMEFLGDAVLELVVTQHLYSNYPNPEGELTNWRAALVNSNMLAQLSTENAVEEFLLLSRGEAKDSNSKARQYILANAFEALIGAIYLDQGYDVADAFIQKKLLVKLPYILENKLYIDAKANSRKKHRHARESLLPTKCLMSQALTTINILP